MTYNKTSFLKAKALRKLVSFVLHRTGYRCNSSGQPQQIFPADAPGFPYTKSGQNPLMNQFVNCVDVNAQIICHFIGKQNLRQITAFIRIDIIRTHQLTTFLCAACV